MPDILIPVLIFELIDRQLIIVSRTQNIRVVIICGYPRNEIGYANLHIVIRRMMLKFGRPVSKPFNN